MSSSFSLPLGSSVLIGGSRSLSPSSSAWVACQSFTQSAMLDHCIHAGCATGADQAAVLAMGAGGAGLWVFSAFSHSGAGAWSGSAVSTIQRFSDLGGSVKWLAGGSLAVPLVARLMARSLAALQGCAAAVFFQPGQGSLKVARAALRQSIPVLVCQVGMSSAPVLAVAPVVVSWFGLSFWLYSAPVQSSLF